MDSNNKMMAGAIFVAFLGFLAWVGSTIGELSDRVARVETTLVENREERVTQISDLRERVTRLENKDDIRRGE